MKNCNKFVRQRPLLPIDNAGAVALPKPKRQNLRLLSKQRCFEEFLGTDEEQDRRVHVVYEDPSLGATLELLEERMFRKKSIILGLPYKYSKMRKIH
jgi:hypothetical protein